MKNQMTMKTEPSSDMIAQRARQIWKAAGCPEGHDLEHWLQAETELRAVADNASKFVRLLPM